MANRRGINHGGSLYCLNRHNGEVLWTFNDNGAMRPVFSSPCVWNGRLYVGEGLHTDSNCKLYCIDAEGGHKLWEFTTAGHTESSPSVVDDCVYFGAGDDGLYCTNATTGELHWHFPGPHVDGKPAVVDGRVYAGSGYGNTRCFAWMLKRVRIFGVDLWTCHHLVRRRWMVSECTLESAMATW